MSIVDLFKISYFFIFFFTSTAAVAETLEIYGARPFLSLSTALNPNYDLTLLYAETIDLVSTRSKNVYYPHRDLQSYIELGLTKKTPLVDFSLGYAFQRNNPFSEDYTNEHRLWQQVLFRQSISTGIFSHRFRLEERFIQNSVHSQYLPVAYRFRYQFNFLRLFQNRPDTTKLWAFSAYNESFFSLSEPRSAFYSENWTYFGLNYNSEQYGRFSFGPLYQIAYSDRNRNLRTLLLLQAGWSLFF